jgi:hypothetical protein
MEIRQVDSINVFGVTLRGVGRIHRQRVGLHKRARLMPRPSDRRGTQYNKNGRIYYCRSLFARSFFIKCVKVVAIIERNCDGRKTSGDRNKNYFGWSRARHFAARAAATHKKEKDAIYSWRRRLDRDRGRRHLLHSMRRPV